MPTPKKSGALSNKDRSWIIQNINKMTVEEMSNQIGKNIAVIEAAIKTHTNMPEANNETARWNLKKSLHWKHLKEEFNEAELNKIEDQYVKYVDQFREDIVATEEVQILNLIKLEILADRNLKGKMSMSGNIDENQKIIDSMLGGVDGDWNRLDKDQQSMIMELKKQTQACLDAVAHRTSEYVELQKQHNALADKVMGSRDQRVKEILNQKVSFLGLVKELLDREKQLRDSRILELHNLGTEKEYKRLIQPHKYADDLLDNPILSAETIGELNKLEKQETLKEEYNDRTHNIS